MNDKPVIKSLDPAKLKKWFVPEERYQELYRKIENYIIKFILFIGFEFGLRGGELLFLEEEQFVWEETNHAVGYINIKAKWIEEDLLFEPKTGTSIRRLPIQQDQKNQITAYFKKIHDYLKLYYRTRPHKYVIFSTKTKERITYNTLYTWIKDITLPFTEEGKTFTRKLRPHILRYSFAVNFYRKTNDLLATSKMLGHNDLVTTEIYLNLTKEQIYTELSKVTRKLTIQQGIIIDIQELYVEQARRVQDLKVLKSVQGFKENEVFNTTVEKLDYLTRQLLKLVH